MDVSIILFYNQDRGWLKQATDSAKRQIFKGKYEIVEQFAPFLVSKNINEALKRAKGKYIKLLSDDDLLTPNCLQDLFNKAESGNYDVVCANSYYINSSGFLTEPMIYKSSIPLTVGQLALENTFHGGTMLYNTKRLEEIGGFNEAMWTGEEYELHLRMANAGFKFGYIDSFVFKYRLHNKQKSQYEFTDGDFYIKRQRFIRDVIKLNYQLINKPIYQ